MYGQVTIYAFLITTAVALTVVWWDLKTMTIPNWLTGGAFVLFAALVFIGLDLESALTRLMGAGIELVATYQLGDRTWLEVGALYERLQGSAADSPIVQQGSDTQTEFRVGLRRAYGFRF